MTAHELPTIDIVVITYRRPELIEITLNELLANMNYDGRLRFVIADDTEPEAQYADEITDRLTNLYGVEAVAAKTIGHTGWGANANYALQNFVISDIFVLMEDDYVLTKHLDLSPYVAAMLVNSHLGIGRLDGIAGHRASGMIREVDVSRNLPHYNEPTHRFHYFQLDTNNAELYLYSNRPHIMTRRAYLYYGPYAEGRRLGETEENYAHRVRNKMAMKGAWNHSIFVALDNMITRWEHRGESFQHTELDR